MIRKTTNQREEEILRELARVGGSCRVSALARQLGVTNETIRRNVRTLEDRNIVRKVHGGVHLVEDILEPTLENRLTREVDDDIRREIVGNLRDQYVIFKHPLGHREMRVLKQHLMSALLQLDVIVVGHAVKAVDAEPFVEQELCKVETDEAGGAGDEDFSHGRIQY